MKLEVKRTRSMTRKQASALRSCLKKTTLRHVGGYEVKSFMRHDYAPRKEGETTGTTFFAWTVGLKGDEDTLASIFGRDYYYAVVGPKGGITKFIKYGQGGKADTDMTYKSARSRARSRARPGY